MIPLSSATTRNHRASNVSPIADNVNETRIRENTMNKWNTERVSWTFFN